MNKSSNNPSPSMALQTLQDCLSSIAARTSTPGGGSVAAICAAQGAALLSMVCAFSRDDEQLIEAKERCTSARHSFLQLSEQDIDAFNEVMRRDKSALDRQKALQRAAEIPILVMKEAAGLAETAGFLEAASNKNLITDVAIGANLLASAIHSAEVNVHINYRMISDKNFISKTKTEMVQYLTAADRLSDIFNKIRQQVTT